MQSDFFFFSFFKYSLHWTFTPRHVMFGKHASDDITWPQIKNASVGINHKPAGTFI